MCSIQPHTPAYTHKYKEYIYTVYRSFYFSTIYSISVLQRLFEELTGREEKRREETLAQVDVDGCQRKLVSISPLP